MTFHSDVMIQREGFLILFAAVPHGKYPRGMVSTPGEWAVPPGNGEYQINHTIRRSPHHFYMGLPRGYSPSPGGTV